MIQELANYISFELPSSWVNCYYEALNNYSRDWLDKFNLKDIMNFYQLPQDFQIKVQEELSNIKKDDKLDFICYLIYYILFFADEKDYYNIWSWKQTSKTFNNHGSYYISLIALLLGCELHKKNMDLRGFDEEQRIYQIENIKSIAMNDSKIRGINGIRFSQMIWGSNFIKGNLIQIGRLQFEVGVRNFNKLDNYFNDNCKYVYIHIPSGSHLLENEVDDSLNKAKFYINKYYPEYNSWELVYFTETWLLSPELKEILPADSNIIKFQNKFNILDYEENTKDFLNFIFQDVFLNIEYNDLKEDTSLQREIKKKLLNGETLHLGIGILK